MAKKIDALPWRKVLTESEIGRTLTIYCFGPLTKMVEKTPGHIQVRTRYYDHKAKFYQSEEALIDHMNYLAKKAH